MEPNEDILLEDLRARIHALLSAAGVEIANAALMLFPVPSRPGCHVVVAHDDLNEAIEAIAQQVGLQPVLAHRGVWLHIPDGII